MESVCRLCLAVDDDALNIFSNTNNVSNIPLRIIQVTSLEVENGDGLPQRICTQCRLDLEYFYQFRKRCQAADRRLRQHKKLLSMNRPSDLYAEDEDIFRFSRQRQSPQREVQNFWHSVIGQDLRSELETHKKQLTDICKQELRTELELQIRSEMDAQHINNLRKHCQLNILDELFFDLEEFLIRKRDEALGLSASNTPSDIASEDTLVEIDTCQSENDTVNIIEINDDIENSIQSFKQESTSLHYEHSIDNNQNNVPGSNLQTSSSSTVPMVEIPMQENQLELNKVMTEHYYNTISDRVKTRKKKNKNLCRTHAYWRNSKRDADLKGANDCLLCNIRKKPQTRSSLKNNS